MTRIHRCDLMFSSCICRRPDFLRRTADILYTASGPRGHRWSRPLLIRRPRDRRFLSVCRRRRRSQRHLSTVRDLLLTCARSVSVSGSLTTRTMSCDLREGFTARWLVGSAKIIIRLFRQFNFTIR